MRPFAPRRSCPYTSGPVAQLGARFHGMEEVVGSIPTRSTKSLNNLDGTSAAVSTKTAVY